MNRKIIIILFAGIIIGLTAPHIFMALPARADFFDDLWTNFALPFKGNNNIDINLPPLNFQKDTGPVKNNSETQTAFLGVRYVIITPEMIQEKNLSASYGALVFGDKNGQAVFPKSPAEKAGLKEGDIIIEVDRKKINSENTLIGVISRKRVGQTVSVRINRSGKEMTVRATLEKRP